MVLILSLFFYLPGIIIILSHSNESSFLPSFFFLEWTYIIAEERSNPILSLNNNITIIEESNVNITTVPQVHRYRLFI